MAAGGSVDQSDLKRVKGIGPKVEARLKDAGITSLGQLARTPVNELAAILEGLTGKFDTDRIIRENWLAQAAALAVVLAADAGEDEPTKRVRHNFTVEVQLAIAGRDIVSSKVVHVQTGDEATWVGWDGQRIVAFIEDRAGARSPASAAEAGREARSVPPSAPASDTDDVDVVDEPGLALHTFALVPATGPGVTGGGTITATLSFDTAVLALPADRVSRIKADVYEQRPPPEKSILVGSALADISPGEHVRLQIPCELPTVGQPVSLFAVAQLSAVSEAGRTPSRGLPNADMTLSRTRAMDPGHPGSAVERNGGAVG
jgi:hypothetical protein